MQLKRLYTYETNRRHALVLEPTGFTQQGLPVYYIKKDQIITHMSC